MLLRRFYAPAFLRVPVRISCGFRSSPAMRSSIEISREFDIIEKEKATGTEHG